MDDVPKAGCAVWLWSMSGKGVREGEVQKKSEASTLQEQITLNEARSGSSQISELLH